MVVNARVRTPAGSGEASSNDLISRYVRGPSASVTETSARLARIPFLVVLDTSSDQLARPRASRLERTTSSGTPASSSAPRIMSPETPEAQSK